MLVRIGWDDQEKLADGPEMLVLRVLVLPVEFGQFSHGDQERLHSTSDSQFSHEDLDCLKWRWTAQQQQHSSHGTGSKSISREE
ncbi:Bifunctional uridylyltransferase/uridylyl-removing enzyme [Frankliniella fusca]|uniref:Bifunctional uridylyltransferase/uridylyl-removing enzyme n=1 Tax=Frankliniella fusca TaxID=407009 RepID=A0AAE1HBV4_9NEOP|nr:Bifunctional uridylyltransferase/uridylyl-removing enzyme [Frankliniella fusca]